MIIWIFLKSFDVTYVSNERFCVLFQWSRFVRVVKAGFSLPINNLSKTNTMIKHTV